MFIDTNKQQTVTEPLFCKKCFVPLNVPGTTLCVECSKPIAEFQIKRNSRRFFIMQEINGRRYRRDYELSQYTDASFVGLYHQIKTNPQYIINPIVDNILLEEINNRGLNHELDPDIWHRENRLREMHASSHYQDSSWSGSTNPNWKKDRDLEMGAIWNRIRQSNPEFNNWNPEQLRQLTAYDNRAFEVLARKMGIIKHDTKKLDFKPEKYNTEVSYFEHDSQQHFSIPINQTKTIPTNDMLSNFGLAIVR